MQAAVRVLGVVGLAVLAASALPGCGKKDPLMEAAPPPSANAVQEQTRYKNMPGPNAPAKMGGTAPGAGPGAMEGPVTKPPGM